MGTFNQSLNDNIDNVKVNVNVSGGGGSTPTKFVYSTEPVEIGEWLDGRPVYRQVLDIGNGLISTDYNSKDISDIVESLELDFMVSGVLYGENYRFTTPARLFRDTNTRYYISASAVMGSGYNKFWICDYVKRSN